MDFFSALTLFGGLAMFLYGMRLMGDALKESSSGTLKVAIEHVTDNPVKAFLLGLAITAVIQSSTATIVITSGLVGAGILSLHQSLGIIVGANVGTTVTGQIIRLLDMEASSGSVLRLFQPSSLSPIALIIGIVLIMGFENRKNYRSLGNIAMGFGILFCGLLNMTNAVKSIQESGIVETLFSGIDNNPLIGYATGAGVAFVLQSSSAAVGILQAFSTSGLMVWRGTYPVIVGIYLGDCVTTAIVCYIGAEKEAQRVGVVNILFNFGKTLLVLVGCGIFHQLGFIDWLWDRTVNSSIIANTNTIFNLVCAVVMLPLLGIFEKASRRIIKDDKVSKDPYKEKLDALNPAFFATPALALNSCYEALLTLLRISSKSIGRAMPLMEDYNEAEYLKILQDEKDVDRITDHISRYIVDMMPHLTEDLHLSIINQYYKTTTEFEHLGDFAEDIARNAENLHSRNVSFSAQAVKEVRVLEKLVLEMLEETEGAFEKRNLDKAFRVEALVQVSEEIIEKLKNNHLKRLVNSQCNSLADVNFVNLLTQYGRIADSCSNIGAAIIIRIRPELADKEHVYYHDLHKGRDEQFNALCEEVRQGYDEELAGVLR
ncbi:MAG: Na/Pi cotransporter family protein [Lachnospiraceae bacterium]|nr:Na/Pi cotransporter family protein [Lachnospiraceae bacterium]